MESNQGRRSPRLAIQLPIRVFGTDYQGKDFVEDSTTLVVGLHGAKIRLSRQLVPEQQVRIFCHPSSRDAVFRVVARGHELGPALSFWGVECLQPQGAFWGITFPSTPPTDQASVHVMVQCPECRTRELLHIEESVLESLHQGGWPERTCQVCGWTGPWKQVDYWDS